MLHTFWLKVQKSRFMFEELTKRDFKQKYKRSMLGIGWSILSPLLTLLVMRTVFTTMFGRTTPHYTTYIFAGNLIFSFFKEATSGGMGALVQNASIFTKINVPKYIFLLTKNVSAIINFSITLIIFFVFAALDGVTFSWHFVLLIYPVFFLMLFNIGWGLILSALYVFFRDMQYLYDILTLMLMYLSAIFYQINVFTPQAQKLFYLNPIYCFISYVRTIVLDNTVPSPELHLYIIGYAVFYLAVGCLIYKKKNTTFLYYM